MAEVMKPEEAITAMADRIRELEELVSDRDDLAQRFLALSEMISPDGTKEERLGRLVDLAKAMGFRGAETAFWDQDNPECGCSDTDMLLDYDGGPVVADIGIFLGDSVIVQRIRVDEDSEDFVADDPWDMEAIIKEVVGAGGDEG